VLGIGTANPIGIAGGLFHMLNNAIYKSCLFLGGGAVEKKTGTTDLDKLGGLAKIMPVTFAAFLIASLAISGVPPFNGFASKWMVYQGVIETAKNGGRLWMIWLVAAMLGSALTLASFMKLLHAIFLGQPSKEQIAGRKAEGAEKTALSMWLPTAILAALCVLFGVFAYAIPLKMFILPSLKEGIVLSGMWAPGLATILILAGIAIGFVIYLLGTAFKTRRTEIFVGGETLKAEPDMRISGTEFYDTIKELGLLRGIYALAEKKVFDIYDVGGKIAFAFTRVLRYLHNGILPTYLAWCLLGMAVLFYIILK